MKQTALTIYIFAVAFLLGALFIPPMVLLRAVTWRDPAHRLPGRLMRFYGRLLFRLMPGWHCVIEGCVPEDIGSQGYVVIANHQTTGDVFLLSNMPWDMRWVSKVELMKFVPVLGLLLWLSGDIPVRRGDKDCTMYGGQCGAGTNNYFFANGKIYYCGNCIDLPPVGRSDMTFEELEKVMLQFDRNYCYKESL